MTLIDDARSSLPVVFGGNVFGWTVQRSEAFALLDAFVDAGGRHIDTADVYPAWVPGNSGGESESIIGDWLAASGKRDNVFLATKVGSLGGDHGLDNLRPETITRAVEDSLRRLRTDRIDLYWAHRDDADTPQEETLAAFDSLVRAGKVRHLGASNFSGERLESALKTSDAAGLSRYEAVQPLYNLLEAAAYESELEPVVAAHGLASFPYSSLASGFLTGKYRPGTSVDSARSAKASAYGDARGQATLRALDEVAQAHGVPVTAVSLAWLVQQPTVAAPIASARTLEQLADIAAVAGLVLTDAELTALRTAATH